jgi:uncharacterized Zn finger protein
VDGIKAQSKRGAFGTGPWAKRWIAVLEAFALGTRLSRGRSYARSGQVTEIAIELGGVRARVQGSRAKPYDVTIRMRELTSTQWQAVGAAIAADVRLAATLLAGEMPADIEPAFAAADVSLFPTSVSEMKTACSCPDWSNPCKHIAAVFYLIGEEFDRDPFALFAVRGLERAALRDLLAAEPAPEKPHGVAAKSRAAKSRAPESLAGQSSAAEARAGQSPAAESRASKARAAQSKSVQARPGPGRPKKLAPNRDESSALIDASQYWGGAAPALPARVREPIVASGDPAVLKRAGNFPFWRGDVPLSEALAQQYADAAAAAIESLAALATTPQRREDEA